MNGLKGDTEFGCSTGIFMHVGAEIFFLFSLNLHTRSSLSDPLRLIKHLTAFAVCKKCVPGVYRLLLLHGVHSALKYVKTDAEKE